MFHLLLLHDHMLHDKGKSKSRIILLQLIYIADSEFKNDSKRAIVAWMISLNSKILLKWIFAV